MATRIITALIGLPVFLFLLYQGGNITSLLVLIIIITGIKEALNMMKISNVYFFSLLAVFSVGIFLSTYYISLIHMYALFVLIAWMHLVVNFSNDPEKNKQYFYNVCKVIFIYSYVTIPLYHIVLIRNFDHGFEYVLFMFLIIWTTDSFAYFTGRAIGKHKMAPLISPKKTKEGAIGGSLSAVIITLLINYRFEIFPDMSSILLAVFIVIMTIVSQMGDLFESCLKRIYNIKDSGSILPGHGGVLDRFDSTIFVAPVYYLILGFLI